ncbi:hypothetical protein J3A83DRAFT_4370150 [Scleroderma citrinum]
MSDDEQERLLSLLEVHGQQFLSSFDLPPVLKKKKLNNASRASASSSLEEEWNGFGGSDSHGEDSSSEERDEEYPGDIASSSHTPDVTIFSNSKSRPPTDAFIPKALRKSFMSAKIANITRIESQQASSASTDPKDSEDDRTNAQNDALLYRLLHTKLLSGSLNPDLNLSHAQREKALSGRVLELSGDAKLGKGESTYRQGEHRKASKRVREGLQRKKAEREQKELVEAKNLGNYHPVLKQMFTSSSSSAPKRKRQRGLRMGVGRFEDGTLKLSRQEISAVTGTGNQTRNRKVKHRRS